jgi:hypothetical protein
MCQNNYGFQGMVEIEVYVVKSSKDCLILLYAEEPRGCGGLVACLVILLRQDLKDTAL